MVAITALSFRQEGPSEQRPHQTAAEGARTCSDTTMTIVVISTAFGGTHPYRPGLACHSIQERLKQRRGKPHTCQTPTRRPPRLDGLLVSAGAESARAPPGLGPT